MDTSIDAGANRVERIDFPLSDKKLEQTRTNLIREAMKVAKTKADILHSSTGMRVLGITSIGLHEFGMEPNFSSPIPFGRQSAANEAKPTPILSGQHDITVKIDVTFLIQ